MKFGICFANTGPMSDPGAAVDFARSAERLGIESLWASHHSIVSTECKSPYPYSATGKMPGSYHDAIPDPLIWLAFIAASTNSIRIATGALILPQLNPVILAKQLATIDHLSNGRLEFGFGIGWMREEFDAVGVPFEERGERADDYVRAMRALWTQPDATYEGKYTKFQNCILRPQPVQRSIPVHIGGHSISAARRAGTYGDGFLPLARSIDQLTLLLGEMNAAAVAADRDGADIEVTTTTTLIADGALEELTVLDNLGVSRVLIPAGLFTFDPLTTLETYHANVMSVFGTT